VPLELLRVRAERERPFVRAIEALELIRIEKPLPLHRANASHLPHIALPGLEPMNQRMQPSTVYRSFSTGFRAFWGMS
jgi:hypothetical protein